MSAAAAFDIAAPLPTGTVLLEASAGTGKTWTIAALVTRYVAEGVATLPEMLIVTFGRAASQELRARVREQLVLAERAFADPSAGTDEPDALLELLLDAPAEELHLRHRRIRAALTHFDAATIATTHQFCQQVLRSLGVAGATDAGASLVEDLDDLLVEVVDDLYLRGFHRDGERPVFTRDQALKIARVAINDIHAELRPTAAEHRSVADRRVRFAQAVRTELDQRKRRLQVMHYNDLLVHLADALEPEDSPARARMRRRWRIVLVDEFQDTDPIQWQVLERAFAGHAHALVLIGDPKQAIYAFRGGDIFTYLHAAQTATDRRTLPRNYRSDQPLVDALGVLLGGAHLGDADIAVHPITAHRDGSRLAVGEGSTVGSAGESTVGPAGESTVRSAAGSIVGSAGERTHEGEPAAIRLRQVLIEDHLTKDTRMQRVREHITEDLARDIAALLASGTIFDGRPIEARDIAVLAHRGKDLVEAQAALHQLGIPAVSAGGASVLSSRAAQDWLALLDAMAAPHRSLLTRGAALTSLLGYRVEDLAADESLDDRLAAQCRDLAATYSRQGIAAVLEILTAAGLSARVLREVGGERTLTDLRHVAQLLHDVARRDDLGLVALLAWLRAAMAEDAPQSSGARTRRLDSDAAAVQLVTIHGSKGLQYPVVYLPSLADRFVSKTPDIPLFHEGGVGGEQVRCIDVEGPAANPTWSDAVEAHKREDSGESLRLLYVALTRAQSQVVAWWAPGNNAPHSPLHRMLFGRVPPQPADVADSDRRPRSETSTIPEMTSVPSDDATATDVLRTWERAGAFRLETADHAPIAGTAPPPDAPDLHLAEWTRSIDDGWRRTSYTALSSPPGLGAGAAGSSVAGGDSSTVGSEPEVVPREDEPEVPEFVANPAPGLPGLEIAAPGADVPSPMADLPVGTTFGSLVHAVLEHADPSAPDLEAELLAHIEEQRREWPVDLDEAALAQALVAVCDTPLGPLAGGVTLRDIARSDRLCELDFELPLSGGDSVVAVGAGDGIGDGVRVGNSNGEGIGIGMAPNPTLGDLAPLLHSHLPAGDPVRGWATVLQTTPELAEQPLRGYLTGSIDVVLRTGGRYLVVDYKTNWLGSMDEPLTAANYRPELLADAMGHSSYPLQAVLYAVVAHRFLRWRLPDYDPEQHLGGVLYLYVRGMCGPLTPITDGHPHGVFSWRPPVTLVEAISDLLDGRAADGSAA